MPFSYLIVQQLLIPSAMVSSETASAHLAANLLLSHIKNITIST